MTVVMQLELILKYFKTAFNPFKVFTGLLLHHLTTFTGGWEGGRVGGLSETENKAISVSIEIFEVFNCYYFPAWVGGWVAVLSENKTNSALV